MMQMTRAAFQAVASLNEQATDPKSHTLVRITYTLSSPVLSPANSDGRPQRYDDPRDMIALLIALIAVLPTIAAPEPAEAKPQVSPNTRALDDSPVRRYGSHQRKKSV